MMKSVAFLDSIPQDEDFVLVINLSDLETHGDHDGDAADDEAFLGDGDSYDYCEDALDDSSIHQTMTSTSNPLQVVQENFFAESPAVISAHPRIVGDSFSTGYSFDQARHYDGDPLSDGPYHGHLYREVVVPHDTYDYSAFADNMVDEVSFNASTTDSSQVVSDQEVTQLLLQMASNFQVDIEACVSADIPTETRRSNCSGTERFTESTSDAIVNVAKHNEPNTKEKSSTSRQIRSSLPVSITVTSNQKTEEKATELNNSTSITSSNGVGDDEASLSSSSRLLGAAGAMAKVLSKKKRRKQLKIAKKATAAASAAAALGGQFAMLKSTTSTPAINSQKRKGRGSSKKVANIAVAEAVKTHQEYKQLVAKKKLR